ncbi:tctex1 domain-containing protein 4-like [Arapaima gigas]
MIKMTTQESLLFHDSVLQLVSDQGEYSKGQVRRELRNSRPPPLLLKGAESSRRSSVLSVNLGSPFLHRETVPMSKHTSPGAWVPSGRLSFSGLPIYQPLRETRLENTYKTGPDEGCRFDANRVQQILQSTLDSFLSDVCYCAAAGSHMSQTLSERLCSQIRDINPPRYKLICFVVLGQRSNQDLQVASRCLWDTETDNTAVAVFQNSSLFAVVIVYGMYSE